MTAIDLLISYFPIDIFEGDDFFDLLIKITNYPNKKKSISLLTKLLPYVDLNKQVYKVRYETDWPIEFFHKKSHNEYMYGDWDDLDYNFKGSIFTKIYFSEIGYDMLRLLFDSGADTNNINTLLTFYLFSGVILISSLMVISTKNPVHSVLFLILSFLNAAGLFVILHAEFLAMILIIVYVGAVAVLFLFVVMMLDFKTSINKDNILQYIPIGILIGVVFIAELIIVLINTKFDLSNIQVLPNPLSDFTGKSNTEAIGSVLYTDYILYFQLSGVILLVAMIGSIVLTLREREGVKRQVVSEQLQRQGKIDLVDVKSGKGVDI